MGATATSGPFSSLSLTSPYLRLVTFCCKRKRDQYPVSHIASNAVRQDVDAAMRIKCFETPLLGCHSTAVARTNRKKDRLRGHISWFMVYEMGARGKACGHYSALSTTDFVHKVSRVG